MAVITANTGSNNWNTNAAWVGGVQPSATSDVVIPASAVVTIPAATTVLGRSLTVQASGTLAFAATTSILTLGDGTAGAGNVSLSVSATATITLTGGDATINFISTSAAQQTITSGGKTIPSFTINGVGSSYILGDALTMPTTSTTQIILTAGTFNTGNFAITGNIINSTGSSTRTLTLGSSAISLARNGTAMNIAATGLTMTANTAVITCTAAATVSATSVNMNGASLVCTSSGTVTLSASGGTWKNVTRTGTAAKTDIFIVGGSFTCTGTFTATGNSITNRLLVVSNTLGTARTITAAAVSLTNVDFKDITGAGAASWTGTSIGNSLGNTNITFTVNSGTSNGGNGVNRYWVGGTGSWSNTANWSTSDGGTSGASVPLPQDDVFFTSNSMGGNSKQITMDMQRIGRNIDFTGTTGTGNNLVITNALSQEFYGNMTMGGTMTINTGTGSGTMTAAGRGSHTITSNGQTWYGSWTITAPGGTYTLQDDLNTFLPQIRQITFSHGSFNANGWNLSHGVYVINATMTLVQMGSGTWSVTRPGNGFLWQLAASPGVISCGTSTILFTAAATGAQTFTGNGATYYTLTHAAPDSSFSFAITGSNTFNTLNIGSGRILTMPSSQTNTISNWNVNGTNNGYIYLPAVANNYISVPDSTALSITGDIDIRIRLQLSDYTSANTQRLITKWGSASTQSYRFTMVNKTMNFNISTTGADNLSVSSSSPATLSNGTTYWLRVTRRQSDGRVQFFQAPDNTSMPSSWTQVGINGTISSGTAMFDSTSVLEIGSENANNTGSGLAGRLYWAQIRNNVADDGTGIQLDANFGNKAFGANSFTESSPNAAIVSINGTSAQVGDGRVSLVSSIGGTAATITKPSGTVVSDYLVIKDSVATGGASWYAGVNSTNVSGNTGWIFTNIPARGNFFEVF